MTIEGLRDMIEELRERVSAMASQFVVFTKVARTGADGSRDEAQVSEDDKDNQRPYLRTTPWGLAGRPVVGVQIALGRAFGGSFGGVQIGIYTKDYGPQDLEEGETALYCKASGTRVWLDKDGNIHVDAASAKDVIINGGSLNVARKTDPVKVTIPASTFLIAATGGGTLNPDPVEVDGTIQDGADHILG